MRLTGTRNECARFLRELTAATAPGVIQEVSDFYGNRAPSLLGRVYLELTIPDLVHDLGDAEDLGDVEDPPQTRTPTPRPAPRVIVRAGEPAPRRRRWAR